MRLIISICIALVLLTNACNLLSENDCSLTQNPLTTESLITSSAKFTYCEDVTFRQPMYYELFFIMGSCTENPKVEWTTPEYTSVPNSGTEAGIGTNLELSRSGQICAQLTGENNQSSEQICRDVNVIRANVWGQMYDEFPDPRSSFRTVSMTLNGDVYSGFGYSNSWYRFDTITWEWEEKATIPDLLDFKAYAGFSIDNKAYLMGLNNLMYQYDPQTNEWTYYDTLPVKIIGDLKLSSNKYTDNDFFYPLVGEVIDGVGYFGIGAAGNFYAYHANEKEWVSLPSYPQTYVKNKHVFVLKNKLYVGNLVFDPQQNKWNYTKIDFALPYGGPIVYDHEVYFCKDKEMYSFNGEVWKELGNNTPKTCNSLSAQGNFIWNGAKTGNIYIMPNGMSPIYTEYKNVLYFVLK